MSESVEDLISQMHKY